jgi:glucose-6-phosphate 1-epimerase
MIDQLNNQFRIPGAVAIEAGLGGMPRVILTHQSGAGAEIYLHGAHLTAWHAAGGENLLFVSRKSAFGPDLPIRGGVPLVFPQFSGQGSLPQHGIVRTATWALTRALVRADGLVEAVFRLSDSVKSRRLWPHAFVLEFRVQLGPDTLGLALQVTNTDSMAFEFQQAFHTYFAVGDVRQVAVYGLAGAWFLDALRDYDRAVESRAAITFVGETDRIYTNTTDRLRIVDESRAHTFSVEKAGMPDAVVWNPWVAKAQRMTDFGDDEYLRMVCVETGLIADPKSLAPGESWVGETAFHVE